MVVVVLQEATLAPEVPRLVRLLGEAVPTAVEGEQGWGALVGEVGALGQAVDLVQGAEDDQERAVLPYHVASCASLYRALMRVLPSE